MDCPDFIHSQVCLKSYNTWKVGGQADYLVEPSSLEQLQKALAWAQKQNLPLCILGDGSNVLLSDKGVEGLVVVLKKLASVESYMQNGHLKVEAMAGASKAEALKLFLKHKLSPALFLTGLPGNIAGGVVMNAGVGESRVPREFCEIVEWVDVLRLDSLKVERVLSENIDWSYRSSLGWQPGVIVKVGMSWPLSPEHPDIMLEIKKATRQRILKQPINQPSCGSVFRNPKPQSSGALIEGCGLKGFSIGRAQVSTKHANFIVTSEGALATDVDQLVQHVQKTVKSHHGINLHPEFVYLGRW